MSEAKVRDGEVLPKGRVNEVCQEWMVREDGALAYRLQSEEINDHLSGNKYRNALVREDFPRAKNEQLREQQLAEQTAMIYHKMLAEQEQYDKMVAKQLAEQLEKEERQKRRALEIQDLNTAKELLDKERLKVDKHSPQKPLRPNYNYASPRRQAKPMPLPPSDDYTVPYECENLEPRPHRENFSLNNLHGDIGLPLDELTEKQIQEEKDAQLARELQEKEGPLEDCLLNRDRMLAIEAQDKELAKMLQERERYKAKKARERAKQKALAKKQLENQQQIQTQSLMPDDSYSYPADLLVAPNCSKNSETYALPHQEEDLNYSVPADVIPHSSGDNLRSSNFERIFSPNLINGVDNLNLNDRIHESTPAVRPTNLDLRAPLNKINKPRYPDPETNESPLQSAHVNIAMAIDPTYPRRGKYSSSSYDTSSTVTTSTSSTSPIKALPSDIPDLEDENSIPPYMPIQGQRRTASLEKKQKKKSKEGGGGCKQQ